MAETVFAKRRIITKPRIFEIVSKVQTKKATFCFWSETGFYKKPPTNNGTEQAIRFVVIDRRVTQGTRSWAGMRFCERAWTVVATCNRHRRSVFQFFLDAVNATYTGTPYPALIPAKL